MTDKVNCYIDYGEHTYATYGMTGKVGSFH